MRGRAPGYSLMEVLIVVAIIGLLATLAAPPFLRMIEQQRRIAALAEAERAISHLPIQAREKGRDLVLRRRGASTTAIERPPFASPLADPEAAQLANMPEGWSASTDADIWFRYDGVCYGGNVTLTSPQHEATSYALEAPLCAPRRLRATS